MYDADTMGPAYESERKEEAGMTDWLITPYKVRDWSIIAASRNHARWTPLSLQ